MEEEQSLMTEKILNLTLEIIYLLTGEIYGPLKKPRGPMSCRSRSSTVNLQSPASVSKSNNTKEILEVTQKITELLMGQEEREYLEGNKEIKLEDQPPFTSLDVSSHTLERCPRPMLSQDLKQEHLEIPPERCPSPLNSQDLKQEYPEAQDDNLVGNNVEAINEDVKRERGHGWQCEEEIFPEISTDGQYVERKVKNLYIRTPSGRLYDITKDSRKENPIHISAYPFSCSVCGKGFVQKFHLDLHRRVHTTDKPYTVESGKSFAKNSQFVVHQRTHLEEKPFSCHSCRKTFTKRSHFIAHELTHRKEKPYSCAICGKGFAQKCNLITHERIHTGDLPFSCSVCGKCFSHKSNLVRHKRIHNRVLAFSCLQCGELFSQKSQLVAHENSHVKEEPLDTELV